MSPFAQQRERIQDDLRGLIAGEVRCDDVTRQLFASDASIYEIRPLGIVRPRSAADVSACLRYAAEKKIPIHARGAGTGAAGESLGTGLILDFSAHLRRMIRMDDDRVRVQPGLVYERLNDQLRKLGRVFGPDPANAAVTTLGSMIAVDASGSHWLKYGSTRRHVHSLQVVLADGQVLEFGREPLVEGVSTSEIPRKREIVNHLAGLLARHADLIQQFQPKSPHSRCGYHLANVLCNGYLNLPDLLAGSEGTLALITEATLDTDLLPGSRGVALLLFDSLEKAARAVSDIKAHGVTACDLMDRRHLSLARESEARFEQLIPSETEAVVLVEQDGEDPLEVRERLRRLVSDLWQKKRLAFGARQAFETDEVAAFWRLTDRVQPALYRAEGSSRPVPVVEDVAVPADVLPEFLVQMQNVLKRNQVVASIFCHAGHGQLHIQPFLDLTNPDEVLRMQKLAEEMYQEVFSVGGGINSEHACGLSRTAFVRQQAGPLFEVLREIKRIFDPDHLLNPNKIVGEGEVVMTSHLRPPLQDCLGLPRDVDPHLDVPKPELRNLVELQLNWEPARVRDAVAACNRCGECRTQMPQVRMCPIFRFAHTEEASPRAKANLIRGVLTGALDLSVLTGDDFKTVADLCVHCHCCRLECPAGVDIPRLMRESKGAYMAANGLSLSAWAATRLDLLGALASRVAPVVNWAFGNRQMRWLLEKTLGIAQGRKLPRVASRSFLHLAARRRLTRPSRHGGQKVLYFVDVYANHYDPQLAEATVAVLEHNGITVYVHPEQKQAGMAAIACGALDQARRFAAHNIAILAESVRQGYHILATEPAAALCLTHEYPQLIDDDDARLVAANSSEVGSFLWKMHTLGRLQLDFRPLNLTVGYHTPCHLKALRVGAPGENLLGLIPGVRLQHIEQGCSGMAGTFGLLHENYRSSLRAGLKLISRLRNPHLQVGATECSACKMQMEQGTTKPTLHPIKLLALSYGLMPEIARLLNAPSEELIVS